MRHLIIYMLLMLPTVAMAQSEWEVPDAQKPQQTVRQAKQKKDKQQGEATAPRQRKMKIDAQYAAGTVPEVDGKVEWSKTFACPGRSTDDLYERTLAALTAITKEPRQGAKSRISAVNRKQHIIAAYLDEEMVFSAGALAKDYCSFRYTLIAECSEATVTVRLCRMSYEYEKGRPGGGVFTAEEWITDSQALNKSQTNFYRLNGKFRKKTIDRKDELFANLEAAIAKE